MNAAPEEWEFDDVPLVLNERTICLLNIIEGPQLHQSLFYARVEHYGGPEKEHKKTAAAIVRAISPWLSTSLIWSLREELAAQVLRVNAETPGRREPHPIDRPANEPG